MKEPEQSTGTNFYMMNASLSLKSIIGFTAFATIFSVFMVNPLMEFITTMVYNSGY
jgi:NADH-quinone oxidoreductase subunit N